MFNIILVSKHLRAPKKINLSNHRTAALFAASVLLTTLLIFGLGFSANSVVGSFQLSQLNKQMTAQDKQIAELKADNQRDMNAMALRLAELQAQANRLNALGIRLTRDSKLNGGEFDFEKTPGSGGNEKAEDISASELKENLKQIQAEFETSSQQLSVLESMLFVQELEL
jgi:uncharacterized protein HemX